MTPSRGRLRAGRPAAPAALALGVLAAGCQAAGEAADATASPAAPVSSPLDGTYEAHIDWAATPPAGCPVAGPGETTTDFRLILEDGRMETWVSSDVDPEPVVGSRSRFRVFRDRIEIDDEAPASARVELDGDTLMFSDMQGGGCDGVTVMTTVPWHRVDR